MVTEIEECVSICPMAIYAGTILSDSPTASVSCPGTRVAKKDEVCELVTSQVTSLLLIPHGSEYAFLVLGTTNGEVLFVTIDAKDTQEISKCVVNFNSPVTALAYGNITGQTLSEIVAICADGTTVAMIPPNMNDFGLAQTVFQQRLQSNITSAYITDIDRDNNQELVAILTDRVVRTFRWSSSDGRLLPINKWEVPCQITAFGIGEAGVNRKMEVWLSQLDNNYYACLSMSGKYDVNICTHAMRDRALMAVPVKSDYINVLGSLINHVVIISNNQEKVLRNFGWPVIATSIVHFSNFTVIVTLHLRGQVLLYAFNSKAGPKETDVTPYEKFTSLPASERLFAMPMNNYSFLIGVSDCEGRYVVYDISVANIAKKFAFPLRDHDRLA